MQPGFMCLEAGLARSKNSINVAVKNLADFCVSVMLFWAFGYALMFGASQAGWIGSSRFFPQLNNSAELAAFFLFQTMFCSTATTIVSGAVAERMKFKAYLIVSAIASGLIYPLFGHWAWNGIEVGEALGWLNGLGFVDFAGSTVVHSTGGWIALAALLVVGPRLGRFPAGRPPQNFPGSSIPLSVLGVMLLWFGWIGFNGGSTLALNDQVPSIVINTVLAGAAGAIVAAALSWQQRKLPDVGAMLNGSIAGLVAITASCHAVSTPLAVIIGGVGAAVMLLVVHGFHRWRIDDAVDAVAVHAGAGAWGTLAVGLFGDLDQLGTGLSRGEQIGVQLLGIGAGFLWAFGLTWLLLNNLNRWSPLRVPKEAEEIGLNVSEHGARTETYELFRVMDYQAQTRDLSLRVPVEPFTEVGHIAARYNQVMEAMQEAVMRTEAIVRTATDAIVTFTTPTLEIITANPSTEVMFGYPLPDLQRRSIADLIGWSVQHLSERAALMARLLSPGQHEVIGRRADGSVFPVEATVTRAELGDRAFYTGTFRDITERKQAEEAARQRQRSEELERALDRLQQTQSQLIQSEKMSSLGQMVAGIAHEINNPVNFIYGNLAYAKAYTQDLLNLVHLYQQAVPDPPPELRDFIEAIELEFLCEDLPKLQDSLLVGAERIREIVQSLRTFSRLDEAEVKEVDIHEGLDSTLMILQGRLKTSVLRRDREEVKIEIVRQYGLLPKVECYAGQLNQVFMNLLSNAIDALEEAWTFGKSAPANNGDSPGETRRDRWPQPTITIRTAVLNDDWVEIAVSDNGPGIPAEVQSKLFDPFFTTKDVGKGTGLGLSISYQIVVERHRGRMECHSQPGEGATFTIQIPIRQCGLQRGAESVT